MISLRPKAGIFTSFGRWLVLAVAAGAALHAQQLAFPFAEGFGRFTSGGRGGDVYVVTNLNDSGAGSLRAGVTGRNVAVPRTVVFAVSGTIYLQSTLRITQGNLTIAGQTAPGDGICLAYRPLDISNSTNVIIRFLRVRLGDVAGVETDAFTSRYATDVMIDHCSFSWSVDETSSTYDNTNLTQQWCFITESMRDSVHSKGAHGYGGIWGGKGATYHHNLIAHHDSRNPRFNGARTHGTADELVDMRNNVIYNWRGNSTYGGEPTDTGLPARHNVVNNTYKNGPATSTTSTVRYRILEPSANSASTGAPYSLFHISGNWTTASSTVTTNNWNGGVQVIASALLPSIRSDTPFEVPPVITQTAQTSYPLVLAYAGCRLPVRDVIDTRIAGEVAAGTATFRGSKGNIPGIIDSQTDVGGWPALASVPAPADTDQDGMPDDWEIARGLNPALASDRNLVDSASGYTQLELYLNALAAPAFPSPVISTEPASQALGAGAPLTLTVQAAGAGPFTYLWFKGAASLPSATSQTYFIAAASVADSGDYRVEVTNAYGTVSSATASVVVGEIAPSVTTSPASRVVGIGGSTTFTVAAAGTAPLSYQWYRGAATPIPGATGASYTIPSVSSASAGSYYVVVSNAKGAATSEAATLTVTAITDAVVLETLFANDTIHAASPSVTGTATNWYVMSSKNATGSSVGDDPATSGVVEARPLDLTMPITKSGVIETAALFTPPGTSRALSTPGDALTLTIAFVPTNVRNLGVGFFNSGGSLPHTGLNNAQLSGTSATLATGGTQNWLGYRLVAAAGSATPTLEARLVQPGDFNNSQSLIIPGTSSSCVNVLAVASASTTTGTAQFADGQPYTLVAKITRSAADAHTLAYSLYAGADTLAAPLYAATAITTATGALPSAVTSVFDAVGIGFRNVSDLSVPRLTLTGLRVDFTTLAATGDAYQAFLDDHALDAGGDGAYDADPDLDGLPNTLEFVLGGDPRDPASRPVPALEINAGGDAVFTFSRHVGAADVFDLWVERSADLSGWNFLRAGTDGVTITAGAPVGGLEQVVVTVPLAAPRDFFRLRAALR